MMELDSVESNSASNLANAKRLVWVFFIYAIALPFVSFILPESEYPLTEGIVIFSWVVILLMPMDLLLVYVIYWVFGKRERSFNVIGPAVLMFVVATNPSVYAVVSGMVNSTFRYFTAPLGLIFSFVGLLLSLRFVSALGEMVVNPNQ
ncbi:MAG: hypothetical protein ACFFBJ_02680 [Promethearchaeota archaeon]